MERNLLAKLKCYQTKAIFPVNPAFKEKYGFQDHVRQFDVVCMTTSLKKANEIAESLGIGHRVFIPNFTYTLERPELLAECEKHGGFMIQTSNRNQFTNIQEALQKQ
jgi:hypothetical protein